MYDKIRFGEDKAKKKFWKAYWAAVKELRSAPNALDQQNAALERHEQLRDRARALMSGERIIIIKKTWRPDPALSYRQPFLTEDDG